MFFFWPAFVTDIFNIMVNMKLEMKIFIYLHEQHLSWKKYKTKQNKKNQELCQLSFLLGPSNKKKKRRFIVLWTIFSKFLI